MVTAMMETRTSIIPMIFSEKLDDFIDVTIVLSLVHRTHAVDPLHQLFPSGLPLCLVTDTHDVHTVLENMSAACMPRRPGATSP